MIGFVFESTGFRGGRSVNSATATDRKREDPFHNHDSFPFLPCAWRHEHQSGIVAAGPDDVTSPENISIIKNSAVKEIVKLEKQSWIYV